MSGKLDALFAYLDKLEGPASLAELTERLARLELAAADLQEHMRFTDEGYTRNSLRGGRWYHAWVLCWKNGQRSPIHDHKGSNCAVRVLRGTMTQTLFEFAANGHIKATGSSDSEPGSVIGSHDMDLHQVSNLQAGNADLVTLHVYSPPLTRMGTYSLTDLVRGEEVWEVEKPTVVQAFPQNLETPIQSVHGWVTPNRLFFVRNHFDIPTIDPSAWRLRIGGLIQRPLELSWEDLIALPERSLFATVECAGNGRSFLKERVPGVQWGAGAIGHAEWTGVPLHLVLERAGIQPGACEVIFEGADRGCEPDHPEPMHFARSLSLDKALHPDTLLAYRMNGEVLTASHGFPLRLFVPGWYGVASVKWLRRIEVTDRPFRGYYQTVKYTVQRQHGDRLEPESLFAMAIKSEIVRPQADAVLPLGANRIFGIAWAGEEPVTRVDVSTDGGQSWSPAHLLGRPQPYCWTLWEYLWEAATPGAYTLLAQAHGASGQRQPLRHDPHNGGYQIHFSRPTAVRVEAFRPHDAESLVYDMNAFAEANARLPLDVELEFSAGEGI
jgi:DMSO/TMAO reductase YedYZ molybdopterin-dependent catalytic subunit